MTTFTPNRHPRIGDGTFTFANFNEPGFELEGFDAPAGVLDVDLVHRISDDLRLGLKHTPDRSHTPEQDDTIWQEHRAARARLEEFGGFDHAVIAAGEMVAARGEEIAGLTSAQVTGGWAQRQAELGEAYEAADQAWKDRPEKTWDGDIYDRRENARREYAIAKDGRDDQTLEEMRRLADGYLEALREVRPMGGNVDVHENSQPKAAKALRGAMEIFPTDWIEDSNKHRPLHVKNTSGRAHYVNETRLLSGEEKPRMRLISRDADLEELMGNPYYELELGEDGRYRSPAFEVKYPGYWKKTKDGSPFGKGWEPWTSPSGAEGYWRRQKMSSVTTDAEDISELTVGGKKISYVSDRDPAFSTAAHEMSHRFGYAVDGANQLETAFLRRRTSVPSKKFPGDTELQPLERVNKGSRSRRPEVCRPDHFVNRYIGREYDHAATEVLSMGTESLFAGTQGGLIGIGRHDSDLEHRAFILGMLATAGTKG